MPLLVPGRGPVIRIQMGGPKLVKFEIILDPPLDLFWDRAP